MQPCHGPGPHQRNQGLGQGVSDSTCSWPLAHTLLSCSELHQYKHDLSQNVNACHVSGLLQCPHRSVLHVSTASHMHHCNCTCINTAAYVLTKPAHISTTVHASTPMHVSDKLPLSVGQCHADAPAPLCMRPLIYVHQHQRRCVSTNWRVCFNSQAQRKAPLRMHRMIACVS